MMDFECSEEGRKITDLGEIGLWRSLKGGLHTGPLSLSVIVLDDVTVSEHTGEIWMGKERRFVDFGHWNFPWFELPCLGW